MFVRILIVCFIVNSLWGASSEVYARSFCQSETAINESCSAYREIPDIYHPRMCDWVMIQQFLSKANRNELKLLETAIDAGGILHDYRCRARRFRLIGHHFWQRPEFHIVPINCSMEEKEQCIICYASFNDRFPQGVNLLQKQLEKIGFRGHFVYRIGGWPDLESGAIRLAHVPYAFKPCFFCEAKKLGYHQILWLDASIRPLKSLDSVFSIIKEKGYFFYSSGSTIAPYCSLQSAAAFGLTAEDARKIPSLASGIVGVSLDHSKGRELIEKWRLSAEETFGFLSPRPDQNALSIIAYLLNMQQFEPIETLCWQRESIQDQTHFFVDYQSVR